MLGLIISTIMIPVLVVHNDFFVQFAPLYALIFLGMTAVAVLRYHLFDIKLIVTETLVIILILALLFEGLTEGSLFKIILKISFSILVGFLGLLLIRSVKKEITQREQLGILNTTLEKTNANLKTANLQLQQLDQQKTDFLSIASHQMRTPLSIFNGYMEILEMNLSRIRIKMNHSDHNLRVSRKAFSYNYFRGQKSKRHQMGNIYKLYMIVLHLYILQK
jgi:signal transduction histidine kinase